MSNIKTDNFEFYTYDANDEKQKLAISLLEDDPQIKKWFGDFGKYFFNDTDDLASSIAGKYLVGYQDEIIGFVSLYDYSKYVDIDCGLTKDFRGIRITSNNTIGTQLLIETADTILKDHAEVEYLRCYIDLNNIRSINAAKKAGFTSKRELIAGYGEYHKERQL